MKKFPIYLLLIICFVNCSKEDNGFGIEESYNFELNNFSSFEKKLFDTLDFNKTNTYENLYNENEPTEDGFEIIEGPREIFFYPNPFKDVVNLSFSTHTPIVSIIFVNNKYKKITTSRFENIQQITYDLTNIPSGVNRLYFVIQDDKYRILEYGKVNIQKE